MATYRKDEASSTFIRFECPSDLMGLISQAKLDHLSSRKERIKQEDLIVESLKIGIPLWQKNLKSQKK